MGFTEFQSTLVEWNGTVTGARGRGWLNYQVLGGGTPGQARNIARVQERAGTPVIVGVVDNMPAVLRLDYSRMEPNGDASYRSPLFSQHGPDHGWAGGDPLYLDTRQIRDLMVKPAGEMDVNILPGWYDYLTETKYFGGQQGVDLSSYQPPTGTKRGVGLYLTSGNVLALVAGAIVARAAAPLPEPAWPSTAFRLAMVILYGEKAFIDFEDVKQRKRVWSSPQVPVSKLVAPDGDPDPAWSVDNDGNLTNPGGGVLDLNGIADGLVLSADGTDSISAPTDGRIDFEAGGVDIARIDSSGITLPESGDDIFISGDEAGLKQRTVDIFQTSITDHFDGSLFTGWSWAGYAGFVTPANIEMSQYSSMVRIYNSAAQGTTRAFAYQGSAASDAYGRLIVGFNARAGLRIDDGTNSNYIELFLESASADSGLMVLKYRYANAGAVTGPTAIWATYQAKQFVVLRLVIGASNNFLFYYTTNGPEPSLALNLAAGFTFSAARSGLHYESLASSPNSTVHLISDWYKQ